MRCASCGTENAPDSRFCGGCGARLAGAESRVAPTQKISEEGQAQLRTSAQQVAQRPPESQPPSSQPPGGQAPRAIPPSIGTPQSTRARTAAAAPRPSAAIAPARERRWGLILVVLLLDLGFATAGAWLLSEGLQHPPGEGAGKVTPSTSSTRADAPAPGTATADATPPAAKPVPIVTPLPAVTVPPPATSTGAAGDPPVQAPKPKAQKPKAPKPKAKASAKRTGASLTPVNPYDDLPAGTPGLPPGSP